MLILTILYVVVVVALFFGLCIFIHELGHFLAAKVLGMVIDTFSIGFGPAIWKKKFGSVLFKVGIFPIGGYVALPQMDPSGLPGSSEQKRILPRVEPWKKIIVAVAGAGGNMLLAYIIAWVVFVAGKPATPAETCTIVGFVETNSAAYAAGLRAGDEILSLNGRTVKNWHEVIQENALSEDVVMVVKTAGATESLTLKTEKNALGLRMVPGIHELTLCKVAAVESGSSAADAGIQSGDLIRKFDDIDVLSIDHLIALTSEYAEQTVLISVERDGKELLMQVTPRFDPTLKRARIGIRFDPMAVDFDRVVHIPPNDQIKSHSTLILRVLRSLMTPSEAKATSEALGGPIMIIFMFQDMVRKGIIIALWFTCLLNVNLALLNLLPIPVLDGGHVIFSLLEIIIRRPLPPKAAQFIEQVFFSLLILAIILITGRDIKRLYQIRLLSKPSAAEQAITNESPGTIAGTNHEQQIESFTSTNPVSVQ